MYKHFEYELGNTRFDVEAYYRRPALEQHGPAQERKNAVKLSRIERLVSFRDSDIVLDFGCGIGQATRIFADAGHEVVGVDLSTPAILHARENVPHGTFETISQEGTLPFPDQNFSSPG